MLSRLLALLLFAACASGLKMMPPTPRSAAMCSRRAVPLVAAGLAFASRAAPAFADDKSKNDKKFISCISECVYNEQKIAKGIAEVEYVTQKEALAKRSSTLKAPPLAVPQLGSCSQACSGRAWWLWAARHSQGEARPLGSQQLTHSCSSQPPPKSPLPLRDSPGANPSAPSRQSSYSRASPRTTKRSSLQDSRRAAVEQLAL